MKEYACFTIKPLISDAKPMEKAEIAKYKENK